MGKNKQNKLTKEEMAKTQVINLEDVKKLASYEKLISKKPALVVALAGILAIIAGVSAQVVVSLSAQNTTNEAPQVEAKIVEESTGKTMTCSYTDNQVQNEQVVTLTYNMTYDEDTTVISNYQKVTTVLPTSTTSAVALQNIENGIKSFKELQKYSIEGYTITVDNYKTGYKVNVEIDNEKINSTLLNPTLASNLYVSYDIAVGSSVLNCESYLKSIGYTCK